MNVELAYPQDIQRATVLIDEGAATGMHEAVAVLLQSVQMFAADTSSTMGTNCSAIINRALTQMTDNPFLAVGLGECNTDDARIRKSYRKLALKYHPDKNKYTLRLFQAVQSGYDTLQDPDKKEAAAMRHRRWRPGAGATARPSAAGAHQPTGNPLRPFRATKEKPSGQPPASPVRASHRRASHSNNERKSADHQSNDGADPAQFANAFNKRFYEEFMRAARQGAYQQPHSGVPEANGSTTYTASGKPQAPPRPLNFRSTARSSTSVTLEWKGCGFSGSTAYELQWRERTATGTHNCTWVPSKQLILGMSCRKKNLAPGTFYEFRVRAASAWGWSGFSDTLVVKTDNGEGAGAGAGAADRQRGRGHKAGPFSRRRAAAGAGGGGDGTSSTTNAERQPAPAKRRFPPASTRQEDGEGGGAEPSARAGAQSATSDVNEPPPDWSCQVCGRVNGHADYCTVCGTHRNYRASKLQNIFRDDTEHHPVRETEHPVHSTSSRPTSSPSCSRSRVYMSHGPAHRAQAKTKEDQTRERWRAEAAATTQAPNLQAAPKPAEAAVRLNSSGEQRVPASSSAQVDEEEQAKARGASPSAASQEDTEEMGGAADSNGQEAGEDVDVEDEDGLSEESDIEAPLPGVFSQAFGSGAGGVAAAAADGAGERGESEPDQFTELHRSDDEEDDEETWEYGEVDDADLDVRWFRLDPKVTKMHNVRSEPMRSAPVIGILFQDRLVCVLGTCGDWFKVRFHEAFDGNMKELRKRMREGNASRGEADNVGDQTGWCLGSQGDTKFMVEEAFSRSTAGVSTASMFAWSRRFGSPGGASGVPAPARSRASNRSNSGGSGQYRAAPTADPEDEPEMWYELRDEEEGLYYFNNKSGVSQWEPPEWMDEVDPTSGAVYYANTATGETQWEMPEGFVPIVREEAYETAEARFVKQVLSPKRSMAYMRSRGRNHRQG